tara:strand:- start:729 stop:1820 length:1092 start_codon:yes stop_codon:yes gene_type:complete
MSKLIHVLLGTKAELIKLAPVLAEFDRREITYRLVETGQHAAHLPGLCRELGVREPDLRLGGTADIDSIWRALKWMTSLLKLLFHKKKLSNQIFDDAGGVCLVHGDTPSTLVATLLARRAGLKVAHLESGLRSGDFRNPFPEELIRVLVMRRADIAFTPTPEATRNLKSMMTQAQIVETSGNTGAEALRKHLINVVPGSGPIIATLHRVENLHRKSRFEGFLNLLSELAESGQDVLFVVHPPTALVLDERGTRLTLKNAGVRISELLPFSDFVVSLCEAPFVITDGGSIQEECARLGTPCLLWRSRTERPDGLGANVVVSGYDQDTTELFLNNPDIHRQPIKFDDGQPSVEVVDSLLVMLTSD